MAPSSMPRWELSEGERFWAKVSAPSESGCRLWMAGTRDGYGRIRWRGRMTNATRVAWELTHGSPPVEGMVVCHRCDTPGCVEPTHLFLGTDRDNCRDSIAKGRRAHQKDPSFTYAPRGEGHWTSRMPSSVARGERAGGVRLTEEAVREIRRAYAGGVSQSAIAKSLNVSQGLISNIVLRKAWAHVD